MTWFLRDDPVTAPAPPPVFADAQVPSRGDQFMAGMRKAHIEGNRWFTTEIAEGELQEELIAVMGGEEAIRPRNPDEMLDRQLDPAGYLLNRIETQARINPLPFGNFPVNREQFDAEVTARLTREREELSGILNRGNNPWVQFGGELVGSLDWYDVAALPIDAPLTAGAKLTAYVGKQFLLGAGLSVPGVLATQAQGERLGFDPGNPVAQVAAGGVLQGALAGIIGGVLRIPAYVATRVAAEKAARPEGADPIAHEAATDAAEEALEAGRPVPAARPFKANPAIPAEDDPAVKNILNLIAPLEARRGYDQVSGYSVIAPPKPLTSMTVAEVLAWQDANVAAGAESSAAGQWQIIRGTLRTLVEDMRLTGSEVFDNALQDRLAVALMKRRGLEDWRAGRISNEQFGNSLAQEWAALPVVSGPGSGRSYYGGDGLNAAGTTADTVLSVLNGQPVPKNIPRGGSGFTGTGRRSPRSTLSDEVSTPAGTRVKVEYQVVDMASLRPATGDLQPRDRSRAASDEQIAKIAARLDPALLMPGPLSDRGTPLVGPDGIIESGNGRVQGLARAADMNPDAYAAYVQAIRDEGYDIPDGMTRPVLIARRTTELDDAGRIQVIRESNTSAIGRMSGTEQARFDADGMTQPVFDVYRPGKTVGSLENAGFVQRFMAGMTPEERAPLMQANGRLSADGLKRIQSALFARAFDAKDLLTLVAETESRAITRLVNMLETLAPDWAYFRSLIDAGYVRPEFDITAPLTEAVRIIANARAAARDGQSVIAAVRDRLAQADMFTPRDPMIEAIIDVFYVKTATGGDRARGIEASEEILKRYTSKAAAMGRADAADLADDAASPVDVLRRAITDEEGGSPYAPLPARVMPETAPDVADIAAAIETFDPARFTDGTASPAVQAADDALLDELVQAGAADQRPVAGSIEELKALVAGGASRAEIDAHPAVVNALAEMERRPQTAETPGFGSEAWLRDRTMTVDGQSVTGIDAALPLWERQAEQLAWLEQGLAPEAVKRNREVTIILGPPAAGKSTIANKIAVARGAAILDSDEIKKSLPEFDGGLGAKAVHEESSLYAKQIQAVMIERGTNIVLPKVGENATSIASTIALCRKSGYRVSLVNMATTPENAYKRMIGRFAASGRIIPPAYLDDVGVRPSATYQALKKEKLADGYAEIDNNGGFGQPAIITDRAGDDALGDYGATLLARGEQRSEPAGLAEEQDLGALVGAAGPRQDGPQSRLTADETAPAVSATAPPRQDAPDATALAEARAVLAPDDILTFGEGDDLVRVSVADALAALEADRKLEQVMEACKIGRART